MRPKRGRKHSSLLLNRAGWEKNPILQPFLGPDCGSMVNGHFQIAHLPCDRAKSDRQQNNGLKEIGYWALLPTKTLRAKLVLPGLNNVRAEPLFRQHF